MVPFYIFSTLLPEILVHRSFTVAASFAFTIVIFGVTLPGKLLNGWLMERFGRRFAISASFALAAVAVALLFTATGTVTLVIGEVLAGLSIMSAFPAVRMYMAEQFPTRTRGRGYTFAEFIGRFIAGIPLPFLLAGLVDRPADIMWCALVFVVAGAVVPWALGRDTRGALTEEPAARVAHQPG
jgi:putative MFS transporter